MKFRKTRQERETHAWVTSFLLNSDRAHGVIPLEAIYILCGPTHTQACLYIYICLSRTPKDSLRHQVHIPDESELSGTKYPCVKSKERGGGMLSMRNGTDKERKAFLAFFLREM